MIIEVDQKLLNPNLFFRDHVPVGIVFADNFLLGLWAARVIRLLLGRIRLLLIIHRLGLRL